MLEQLFRICCKDPLRTVPSLTQIAVWSYNSVPYGQLTREERESVTAKDVLDSTPLGTELSKSPQMTSLPLLQPPLPLIRLYPRWNHTHLNLAWFDSIQRNRNLDEEVFVIKVNVNSVSISSFQCSSDSIFHILFPFQIWV